jgi:diguanylate cyclase (GGDEF)-like protein
MTRRLRPPDRDRHDLEVLHRLAVELPRALSVIGVTDLLSEHLVLAIERADECTISSWRTDVDALDILSVYERDNGIVELYRGQRFPLNNWSANRTLLAESRTYCEYDRDDPDWNDTVRAQLDEWGWQTWIALPLVVENRSVGLIELVDYVGNERWSPRDIAFAQTIANQAAMAVRNAQLYEHLRRQVLHDPLTGLLNHRAVFERLEAELAEASVGCLPLSVIVLDLDDFKSVNDREGHLAGDRLLRRVAECLREALRETDAAGRIGGDEFVLLLPGMGDEAAAVAERLVARVTSDTGTSASAGVARMRPGELDAASLIDRADQALREAKRDGKDTYRLSA